jgi:hypothetical protein
VLSCSMAGRDSQRLVRTKKGGIETFENRGFKRNWVIIVIIVGQFESVKYTALYTSLFTRCRSHRVNKEVYSAVHLLVKLNIFDNARYKNQKIMGS